MSLVTLLPRAELVALFVLVAGLGIGFTTACAIVYALGGWR